MTPDARLAERLDRRRGRVPRAHRRARRDHQHVRARERRLQGAREGVEVVRHDPREHRHPAGLVHERRERGGGGVAHLARSEGRGGRRHELVAGRDDRHRGPRARRQGCHPRGRQHPEVVSPQRPAGSREHRSRGGVLVRAHQALAGRGRAQHLDQLLARGVRVLDLDDGVRPRRQRRPRRDRDRAARAQLELGLLAHHRLAGEVQVARHPLRRPVGVGGAHRVAVHGRAGEAGERRVGLDCLGRHSAESVSRGIRSTPVRRAGRKPTSASETLRAARTRALAGGHDVSPPPEQWPSQLAARLRDRPPRESRPRPA